MVEYRRQFWNKDSCISEEEARTGEYYLVEIDDEENIVGYRHYIKEDLKLYVKYRYLRQGTTDITERVFFDNNDHFQGKQVVRKRIGMHNLVEIYDANRELTDLLRGKFEYIIKKGEIA